MRPGVAFDLDLPPGPGLRVVGDPNRLSEVLTNLLSNAAKFTEHGSVTVSISSQEAEGRLVVRFSVADTGIGLSRETLSRLFTPFMQADSSTTRRFGGTGLGLPITKQLIESMGGHIEVESVLGEGSTFSWFVLLRSSALDP